MLFLVLASMVLLFAPSLPHGRDVILSSKTLLDPLARHVSFVPRLVSEPAPILCFDGNRVVLERWVPVCPGRTALQRFASRPSHHVALPLASLLALIVQCFPSLKREPLTKVKKDFSVISVPVQHPGGGVSFLIEH